METFDTIKKEGIESNKDFDSFVYSELLNESKKLSKLKNILEAFNPDYIVILAWKDVENGILRI